MRVFSPFNRKPILVTFQVWLAVFSGVLWLIFCFCSHPPPTQKNSGFLFQAFWTADESRSFSRSEWPVEWPALAGRVLWFKKIALESPLLSLCSMWGGRPSRQSGLMWIRATEAPPGDYFRCIWEEASERRRIFLTLVDWSYVFVLCTLEGKQCYSLVWSRLSKWESSGLLTVAFPVDLFTGLCVLKLSVGSLGKHHFRVIKGKERNIASQLGFSSDWSNPRSRVLHSLVAIKIPSPAWLPVSCLKQWSYLNA